MNKQGAVAEHARIGMKSTDDIFMRMYLATPYVLQLLWNDKDLFRAQKVGIPNCNTYSYAEATAMGCKDRMGSR